MWHQMQAALGGVEDMVYNKCKSLRTEFGDKSWIRGVQTVEYLIYWQYHGAQKKAYQEGAEAG